MEAFLIGMAAGAVALSAGWLALRHRRKKPAEELRILSSIEQLRAIGQLSVYKVMTKEIVTETDHSWGEFGSRYLGWILSKKKMAMIFEFVIDFRYDLQSPLFEIAPTGEAACTITMPPCEFEVNIRDIRFYDEQGSRFLPWLLPDLLNGFLGGGFSEEDKNRLVDAARGHAEKQALELIGNMQSEVQKSAVNTLESIARAFGIESVKFGFAPQGAADIQVAVSEKLSATG